MPLSEPESAIFLQDWRDFSRDFFDGGTAQEDFSTTKARRNTKFQKRLIQFILSSWPLSFTIFDCRFSICFSVCSVCSVAKKSAFIGVNPRLIEIPEAIYLTGLQDLHRYVPLFRVRSCSFVVSSSGEYKVSGTNGTEIKISSFVTTSYIVL